MVLKHVLYKFLLFIFFVLSNILLPNLACSKERRFPNVVLITIDALRPDHLGCYGYQRNTSPNINKLAKESVVFTEAISQASVTLVSIASVFTASYPPKHGVTQPFIDNDSINKTTFNSSLATISEILKRNNYLTANFIAHGILSNMYLAKKGFDYSYKTRLNKKKYFYISRAENITNSVINWLDNKLQSKMFIYIHYLDVHWPYRRISNKQPSRYASLFYENNKDKLIAPITDDKRGIGGIPREKVIDGNLDINYYISFYDGEIRYVDNQIGILIDYLKKNGLYNDSIIIIIADHGEAFGEHNLYLEHAHTLYDELLRVPLIIKFPGQTFGGSIISKQVRLVDVMPTILEYLDLAIPEYIDGESLIPLINAKGRYGGEFAFSKTDIMNAIRTEEWKLIYHEGGNKYELYNLKQDPGELNNLINEEKIQFESLKARLDKWIKSSITFKRENEQILDETLKEQLRRLGYVQ